MTHTISKRPMYRFLIILTVMAAVGLQTWRTLFNNFAVQQVLLDGAHVGFIQSVREIPGLLSLLAIFFLFLLHEHILSALSVILLGLGLALTGFFPSFTGLALTTLLMSFGFHYYETTNQSLTLQYFDKCESPLVIGRQRSLSAATNIVVGLLIFFVFRFFDYKLLYLSIGSIIVLFGIWALSMKPMSEHAVVQHKKLIIKKKYSLFYILTLLSGARRQIFIVFSVFLLVQKFHFTAEAISLLFVTNNIINYFFPPFIAKMIVRFGERSILSVEYLSLIFIFVGYTYTQSPFWAAFLYILDHIVFNCAVAIRTYFQKIADPRDIAPSMAVGFTINHIAAVILPFLGGYLWTINYKIPFWGGAFLTLLSLLATQFIRTPKKE